MHVKFGFIKCFFGRQNMSCSNCISLLRHVLFLLQWAMACLQLILFKVTLILSFHKNTIKINLSNIELPQWESGLSTPSSSSLHHQDETFNRTMQQQKEFSLQDIQNSSFGDSSILDFQDSIQPFPKSATFHLHPGDIGQNQVRVYNISGDQL